MLKRLFPLFLLAFVTVYFSYNVGKKIIIHIENAKENSLKIDLNTFEIDDFFHTQKLR